jgi:hypothetical protein
VKITKSQDYDLPLYTVGAAVGAVDIYVKFA